MTMLVDLGRRLAVARRADPRPQGDRHRDRTWRSRCACTASAARKRVAVLVSQGAALPGAAASPTATPRPDRRRLRRACSRTTRRCGRSPSARGHPVRVASPSTDKAAHDALPARRACASAGPISSCSRATCRSSRPRWSRSTRNRIINIHPSLLPYHPGANAYKQAFEEGVRVSGCTAHFVTEQLDQGPVILQDVFHIRVGEDTLDEVKARGQALEGKVLSQAVQLFAQRPAGGEGQEGHLPPRPYRGRGLRPALSRLSAAPRLP